jgi:hypothetical protein
MNWVAPAYDSKTTYNRAGKVLLDANATEEARRDAFTKVGNWRAAHRYPLHATMMTLRVRAHRWDAQSIVVQRLKRLPSILPKLTWMRLTQIQDIGGCRAVVRDLSRLNQLHGTYMARSRAAMEGEPDNYVAHPKTDGYRGVHYVFRYASDRPRFECFNGLKVEVQLRTRAQHSWATALEIVDMFTGQQLKTDIDKNEADPRWKRFFQLMGTAIALEEDCPIVPQTPDNPAELAAELRTVCQALDAVVTLEAFGAAVQHITSNSARKGGSYIVTLDTQKRLLRTSTYRGRQLRRIDDDYLALETKHLNDEHIQVVQVDADSLDQLKRAYPNYDLDTAKFVERVNVAMSK